jgi:hypothetical protein
MEASISAARRTVITRFNFFISFSFQEQVKLSALSPCPPGPDHPVNPEKFRGKNRTAIILPYPQRYKSTFCELGIKKPLPGAEK